MNWNWCYYASDKNDRIMNRLPAGLQKRLTENPERPKWPRTIALGPGSTYAYVDQEDYTDSFLNGWQKPIEAILKERKKDLSVHPTSQYAVDSMVE